jgi:hypothetical protein
MNMPIVGITLDAERSFESKYDSEKGKVSATKWKIGTLDSRIAGRLKDMATSITLDPTKAEEEITTNINSHDVAFYTVVYGLRGWTNFKDAAGKDIKFKTAKRNHGGDSYTVADPEVVKKIPQVVLSELAAEINKDNELSAAEEKNSDG